MKTFKTRVPLECIEHQVHQCSDSCDEATAPKTECAIEAFREIIHWIYENKRGRYIDVSASNAKLMALAMLIDPSLVGAKNQSEVKRITRGKIKQYWVSKLMKQFQVRFSYHSSSSRSHHD